MQYAMTILNIKNKNLKKILVTGPVFDKTEKIANINNYLSNYDLIIINGNISFPFNNTLFKYRIDIVEQLMSTNKVIYNIGNLDYKLSLTEPCVRDWIKGKPNVINLTFKNGYRIIITNGGINNKINYLINNIECSFVNYIDDKSWHELYNGKFGYVISNMPLSNGPPDFYTYSARIGTEYNKDMIIYGQEIGLNGLLDTIEI
jgi:predicted phosphodiesterase